MTMKISILTLTICLAWPLGSLAGEVSGTIAADQTWTAAQSPYSVVDDLTVNEGISLTIEPGVAVEIGGGRSIIVQGELIARGTEAEPIRFTHAQSSARTQHWGSIVFEDSSTDAVFQDLDDYVSGSIVEWAVLETATNALWIIGAAPYVHRCTFQNNKNEASFEVPGGAALRIEDGATPRVFENDFVDNVAEAVTYGGAIYASESNPIIQDNHFTGNSSVYGGAVTTDLAAGPIVGNTFEENEATVSEGGAVSLFSTVSAVLNNTVSRNEAAMDGGGIHVCVTCFPHSTPFFMDNTITDNISRNHEPTEGAAGFGAAYLRVFAFNNVHGNLRDGEPSDFGWFHELAEGEDAYPAWVSHPSVSDNWWGTTNGDDIAATIFDGADDEGYGQVDFEPVLDSAVSAPTPRVTITTRKLRYQDVDDPMPVFLTVYNPGAERNIELSILVAYGDGPPIPYSAPLDFPDSAGGGEGYHLSMPANSVYFTTLLEPVYDGVPVVSSGHWYAAIFDGDSGDRIGEVCSIRFDLLGGDL